MLQNVNVVSTVDPFGKKIVCESKPVLNGMETNTEPAPPPPALPPPFAASPWFSPSAATNWPPPLQPQPQPQPVAARSATNGLDNEPHDNGLATDHAISRLTNAARTTDVAAVAAVAAVQSSDTVASSDASSSSDPAGRQSAPLLAPEQQDTAMDDDSAPGRSPGDVTLVASTTTAATTTTAEAVAMETGPSAPAPALSAAAVAASVSPTQAPSTDTMDASQHQQPASRPGKRGEFFVLFVSPLCSAARAFGARLFLGRKTAEIGDFGPFRGQAAYNVASRAGVIHNSCALRRPHAAAGPITPRPTSIFVRADSISLTRPAAFSPMLHTCVIGRISRRSVVERDLERSDSFDNPLICYKRIRFGIKCCNV